MYETSRILRKLKKPFSSLGEVKQGDRSPIALNELSDGSGQEVNVMVWRGRDSTNSYGKYLSTTPTSLYLTNRFCCCCGRLIFGPDARSLLLTILLISVPVIVFCIFVAWHLRHHFAAQIVRYAVMVVVVLFMIYVSCTATPLSPCLYSRDDMIKVQSQMGIRFRRQKNSPSSPLLKSHLFVPCPASEIDKTNGSAGSTISQICGETGAAIKVQEPFTRCDERVVFISEVEKKVETQKQKENKKNDGDKKSEYKNLSLDLDMKKRLRPKNSLIVWSQE